MNKSRIICTIGPSCDTKEKLIELVKNGMNSARLNMSHGTIESHQKNISLIKKIREELGVSLPIIIDTKGPEMRIKTFENDGVFLENGQSFSLTTREINGNEKEVSLAYKPLIEKINIGNLIFANNGMLSLEVEQITKTDIICKVLSGGKLTNNKGLNVPGVVPSGPYLSEKDKNDLSLAIKNEVEFIAASFISNNENVLELRKFLKENGGEKISIISKIENNSGVENIDSIILESDGVMIARGDMGVELPAEKLPAIQKNIIRKCNKHGKIVIVATEMLESMTENLRPTRAEVSDVANAIYDEATSVMLSGETAVGKHPEMVVDMMKKIIKETEENISYSKRFATRETMFPNFTNAISNSVVNTAQILNAKLIIAFTNSGETVNQIAKLKCPIPILGITAHESTFQKLGLSWGTTPIKGKVIQTEIEMIEFSKQKSIESGYAKSGDTIVIASGILGVTSGLTNSLKALVI
ncbi:MAG: pyruvate kinase [Clostridia bacterium]